MSTEKRGSVPVSAGRKTRSSGKRDRNGQSTQEATVSIAEVARRAGVSTATVSRVINGVPNKASGATRERVLQAVASMSYMPSRAGRALRQQRSHIVGVLAPDLGNAYHALIAGSIERALSAQGLVMVLANTNEEPAMQDRMLREMRALQVFGVVMLGAVESPELEQSLRGDEPVVFVNRRSPYGTPARFVGIDNACAAEQVADRLFARRRVGGVWIFHSSNGPSANRDRVAAFEQRFRRLAGDGARLHSISVSTRRRESAYRQAQTHIVAEPRPGAIFCTTDEIAYGVGRHCLEIGLDPFREVPIFGFDGNPMNEYLAPWLNTVRAPHEEFGPAILQALNAFYDTDAPQGSLDRLLPFEVQVSGIMSSP